MVRCAANRRAPTARCGFWSSPSAWPRRSTEELFARGFLYRGWSESLPRSPARSSCRRWSGRRLHLQYDWYLLRRGVHDRPVVRLPALSRRLDLAHDRAARPQQSCRVVRDHLAGGAGRDTAVIARRSSRETDSPLLRYGAASHARLASHRQPVERALQDEDRGVLVDHLRARLGAAARPCRSARAPPPRWTAARPTARSAAR